MKSSAEIKTTILETAGRLFYSQGYNSTGINQVIDEAGIARASLYNHFKSKSDLLYAYLEELDEKWFDQLHVQIDKIKDPKEKIIGLFEFRLKRQANSQYAGCPFIKVSAEVPADDSKAFELINKNKMKFKQLIEQLVQDIPAHAQLSTAELADTLYMLIEGATVTAAFQKNKSMMTAAKSIAAKLLG
ncbi:TetR family transcriptional regulator [Chitinophaga skermanii]|uniref:TetR family transcriptional regulator n=1 Tax=Chitinophaga skermanii TaxID=331697 RepID=A0A327QRA1_9BACT|nr:TetR/AcrR family transcriptional regulator [Chitinophaga skermanii]RAJ06850.1 TetR family transcriptional regulator [Chitinophaga skermanii]